FRLLPALGTITDVRAPGLKCFEVRAGSDLAASMLPRQPDLNGAGLGGGESHVTGTERYGTIVQAQPLHGDLRGRRERLKPVAGGLGPRELHDLHLLELVLTDDPANVLAVRPGFATETRRVRGHLQRKARGVESLIAIEIGERHFGGGDEIKLALRV